MKRDFSNLSEQVLSCMPTLASGPLIGLLGACVLERVLEKTPCFISYFYAARKGVCDSGNCS